MNTYLKQISKISIVNWKTIQLYSTFLKMWKTWNSIKIIDKIQSKKIWNNIKFLISMKTIIIIWCNFTNKLYNIFHVMQIFWRFANSRSSILTFWKFTILIFFFLQLHQRLRCSVMKFENRQIFLDIAYHTIKKIRFVNYSIKRRIRIIHDFKIYFFYFFVQSIDVITKF